MILVVWVLIPVELLYLTFLNILD